MIRFINAAGGNTDDEEAEAVDHSRAKRKMSLASKRLEKNALDSKSKKTRVLVEVIYTVSFYDKVSMLLNTIRYCNSMNCFL